MTQPSLSFQDIILRLLEYWKDQGCLVQQPYNVQVGAGTMNPATVLRVLGPEPWNVVYVEPSIRPDDGRFGDNPQPVLVWHPSEYPEEGVDDGALFEGLCQGLARACAAAETAGVSLAVEITRGGTIDGAERFLRVLDKVGSAALKVCMDAANFAPDRTPLVRAVRTLGPHIAIAHGKDARFGENGEVADYGPAGAGRLDYPAYIGALREYAPAPYFVLEYYRTREELMRARDLVQSCL